MKSAVALLPLLGYVLGRTKEFEFECDDYEVRLPLEAERYKQCSTRDHQVRIGGKDDDGDDVRVEGFPALTGKVMFGSYTAKSLWCDAAAIGDLEIYLSDNLTSISFPNLTTIGSISIWNSSKLTSFHAPQLHTISRWLALTNVPELTEFNVSTTSPNYHGYTFQVGYSTDAVLPIGSFTGHPSRDSVGNVYMSNVSQSLVDGLLNNASIALPAVELHNSPSVSHINFNASRTSNLTINGNGDTIVTLNAHYEEREVTIDKLLLSGVKEIKTDTSCDYKLTVNEVYIVDNPKMKEAMLNAFHAPLSFQTPHVLTIANNPLLESVRFPVSTDYGSQFYDTLSITNNTNLRLEASSRGSTEDSTYRSSDGTIAKFPWNFSSQKMLQLEGYFDMDFFNFTQHDSSIYLLLRGDVIVNSTAPDFKCSKMSAFKQKSSDAKTSTFTCNGDTSVRVKSSASTLLFSRNYLFITLVYGLGNMLLHSRTYR